MAETAPASKRRDLKMSKIAEAVKSDESDVTRRGQAVELQSQRKVNEDDAGSAEAGKEEVLLGKVEMKVEAECNNIRKNEDDDDDDDDNAGAIVCAKEEI